MITKGDLGVLAKLAHRVLDGPTASDEDIRVVQRLVGVGLARDLSYFHGHRTRVYLRIWSITDAGKAVLAQRVIGSPMKNQGILIDSEK